MPEIASLVPMLAAIGLSTAPVILFIRYLAGAEPVPPIDGKDPWPVGVQEEDPRPWRFATVG
jgi:hypothetical protein